MNIRVLGVDICRSSIVCCLLTQRPSDAREVLTDITFHSFNADIGGINGVLELAPDVAVMEPTGVNYQRLWGTKLAERGVEIRLVSHNALPAFRAHLDLPDKDDEADALALACYYFDFIESPRRWLQVRDRELAQIRDLCLRLGHISRVRSPIINRLRQDLAWQFPEIAHRRTNRGLGKPAPILWRWLAGRASSTRHDREYAATVGLGLEQNARFAAGLLTDLAEQEARLELQLSSLTRSPRFDSYIEVFDQFGFGQRVAAIILSQIFPIQNFLNEDGKPIIVVRKGKNSGKPTRRYLSQRRFKKSLGVAPVRQWSGQDRKTMIKSGSALCRKALWQWVFTRIEVRTSRPKTEVGEKLGALLDRYKQAQLPIAKSRMKVAAKAAELLFCKLQQTVAPKF